MNRMLYCVKKVDDSGVAVPTPAPSIVTLIVLGTPLRASAANKSVKLPLGNATAEDCANYCAVMFSDLTRMVTMQNLFHDGGFSFTGVSLPVMEKFMK